MSTKRLLTIIAMSVIGIILISAVFTSWYTVDESEQAIVITFGEASEPIVDSGLKFKMPWPIQSVEKLSKETFSLKFGYSQSADGEIESFDKDTKMITGDDNIVLTDLVVQWKITDPKSYLFNAENPQELLHDATSASIRSVIGNSKIDDALTSGKAQIESDTNDLLRSLIEKYDIGITVLTVKLQDVELPNAEVRSAFTAVTDAEETKNTKVNQAEKYKNQKLSEAIGEKDAIISNANGYKTARIEQAKGDVALFDKLYAEYQNNKEITKQRLVMETLDAVLPNANLYIMNDDGGTMKYLPLQSLEASKQPTPPATTTTETEAEKEEGSGK
ncbi:FtsH protease activity modulator HflK [Psychrobacillus psychrodurans]|jgi:membrane protease subunit HflK|uniref:FtsH protease activity modulator HflK n=1 Tax=Psychrobacillus TaxID=1221880 RepID=UPI0008F34BC5|nr:FtsH protease activity modulator HflK [Psychrobacillus psychrodurans]MCK1996664.1 FtsH protease activity modulator HflK [Psychrobacillus psychrodurans]MCZ8541767.1 FtsH protease activity modulator HflK [Psychrobacillus psychrodurans]SFN01092.1 membrane protease subunit HflK [Psychrobacillus psychrodurans]